MISIPLYLQRYIFFRFGMNLVAILLAHNQWATLRGVKMIYPVSNTLSALTAARKKMDVTANNIANANTDEFKKSRITLSENSNGGVSSTVDRVDTPGIPKETIQNDRIVQTESSNVDLAEELTELIPTESFYGANLKVLKTQQDMIGALLDIKS